MIGWIMDNGNKIAEVQVKHGWNVKKHAVHALCTYNRW